FVDGKSVVAGFCNTLLKMFKIPENESFKRTKFNTPRMSDNDGYDLVLWLRDDDRGEFFHKAIAIKKALEDYFDIEKVISSY
ncbi:peroxidase, partial [Francisella tularensis subsp. holarctica]|nr:peroxidase [Francisella tularensis subsp. holarctica]